eukprot:3254487-Amphidinium_carterae.1
MSGPSLCSCDRSDQHLASVSAAVEKLVHSSRTAFSNTGGVGRTAHITTCWVGVPSCSAASAICLSDV